MKKRAFYLVLFLLIPMLAFADSVVIEDRQAAGFEQITVSTAAKNLSYKYVVKEGDPFKGFNATEVFVTIEGANARYCIDGTTATTSVGHPITAGQNLTLRNKTEIKNFSIIRDDAVDVTMGVTYRYGG